MDKKNKYPFYLARGAQMRQLAQGGKAVCPNCGQKRFVYYIYTINGQIVDEQVGKCDRADNCNYHYTPREFAENNGLRLSNGVYIRFDTNVPFIRKSPKFSTPASLETFFISKSIFAQSQMNFSRSKLYNFFVKNFGESATKKVFSIYKVGVNVYSDYLRNATVFWQIDQNQQIRRGKIMEYWESGKRAKRKDGSPLIYSVHAALELEGMKPMCMFGQHLLTEANKNKTVAVVESEKTAMICSIKYPSSIWIATGGLENLTAEHCSILNNFEVVLFPDLNMCEKWKEKAEAMNLNCKISQAIEKIATKQDKANGLDIADFILMRKI